MTFEGLDSLLHGLNPSFVFVRSCRWDDSSFKAEMLDTLGLADLELPSDPIEVDGMGEWESCTWGSLHGNPCLKKGKI